MPRSKRSQKDLILEYLKEGNSINPMQALHKFNCFRLSAIIYVLRDDNHNIITKLIESHTGNKYAEYSLIN